MLHVNFLNVLKRIWTFLKIAISLRTSSLMSFNNNIDWNVLEKRTQVKLKNVPLVLVLALAISSDFFIRVNFKC